MVRSQPTNPAKTQQKQLTAYHVAARGSNTVHNMPCLAIQASSLLLNLDAPPPCHITLPPSSELHIVYSPEPDRERVSQREWEPTQHKRLLTRITQLHSSWWTAWPEALQHTNWKSPAPLHVTTAHPTTQHPAAPKPTACTCCQSCTASSPPHSSAAEKATHSENTMRRQRSSFAC